MKKENGVLEITEDMLRAANMSVEAGVTITALNKKVVITETDVLDYVPDELFDLFDELGISEDAVREVLLQDNGIAEALAARQT